MIRDPKSQKGPYRDPVPKIGTLLGTVQVTSSIPQNISLEFSGERRNMTQNPTPACVCLLHKSKISAFSELRHPLGVIHLD